MLKINKEDIEIISRNSNWNEKSIDKALKNKIYNDTSSWNKFLQLFFISLGVLFTLFGIIFFFAYNWHDLHKFYKIGLIEGLIILTTLFVLFSKFTDDVKNIILTGTSVLIGVLFAVFGQIYQTGANAYDFFLGWTMAISLWVIIANFHVLWLIYIGLINTTLFMYYEQVAVDWTRVDMYMLLFYMNVVFLIGFILISNYKKDSKMPDWFLNFIAFSAVWYATFGICFGIFSDGETSFLLFFLGTVLLYIGGINYGLKQKNLLYISIIPFSAIIIITAFMMKTFDFESTLAFCSLFIITTVTFLVKYLITLQKKWNYE